METATKIVLKDPKSLTPYAKNAKVHKQKDIEKLAGQIAAFGFDQPILVDKQNVIIKGHKRREAAMQLGLKKVPTIVSDRDEYDNMANRLADNAVVGQEYNDDMLRFELGSLKHHNFDLNLTGLDLGDLEMHLAAMESPAPQLPAAERAQGTRPAAGAPPAAAAEGAAEGPGGDAEAGYPEADADVDAERSDGPGTGRIGGGLGTPVVSYNLVFDDDTQQARWYDFLKFLKAEFDGDTIAGRLDAYLVREFGA